MASSVRHRNHLAAVNWPYTRRKVLHTMRESACCAQGRPVAPRKATGCHVERPTAPSIRLQTRTTPAHPATRSTPPEVPQEVPSPVGHGGSAPADDKKHRLGLRFVKGGARVDLLGVAGSARRGLAVGAARPHLVPHRVAADAAFPAHRRLGQRRARSRWSHRGASGAGAARPEGRPIRMTMGHSETNKEAT